MVFESELANQPSVAVEAPSEIAEDGARAQRGWRYWFPRVATAILSPVLLLGAAEFLLRVFNVGYPTDLTQPCTVKGRPAACYNLFFPAPFFPPGMIKTPQAYAIPVDKPQGTFRIFVLGESAAMGDPDPAYSFSRYLEVMLLERFPSMSFEVVNTGSVAINSHVLLPIGEQLAKQRPDVFIIYSGNNEVVGPYGPGTALTSSGMSLPVIRSSIFVRSTRIGQLLTTVGTPKKEWGGMEMFLDRQVPASSPLMKYVYANFESNLRDTVVAARKSGARVIVSTVATNLKDCGPFASQHREGLSQDDLRSWSALVQQGADLENARSYDEALKVYMAALRLDDQYAELEFRIARCLSKLGNSKEAKQHFLRARDLDTLRFRADSKINDINRSVASSVPGVELVDADAIFAQQSPDAVIGGGLVYEHVHLTPEGNYLLARVMYLKIAGQLAGHPMQDSDVPSQAECERLLAFTPHDRSRIAGEMVDRLQNPPFTNQLNHTDQLLRLMIDAGAPDENPDQTVSEYQWAIAKKPDDRILHYNFGLFLFNFDREAAAQQLKMAQPWDGFPVFAPDGTPIQ
jgi:tetratricopeptide (TPR) repeat protein